MHHSFYPQKRKQTFSYSHSVTRISILNNVSVGFIIKDRRHQKNCVILVCIFDLNGSFWKKKLDNDILPGFIIESPPKPHRPISITDRHNCERNKSNSVGIKGIRTIKHICHLFSFRKISGMTSWQKHDTFLRGRSHWFWFDHASDNCSTVERFFLENVSCVIVRKGWVGEWKGIFAYIWRLEKRPLPMRRYLWHHYGFIPLSQCLHKNL